jgi:hypothetical protein
MVLSKSDTSMSLGLDLASTCALRTSVAASSCTEARKRMCPRLAEDGAQVGSAGKVVWAMAVSPEKKRSGGRREQRGRGRGRGRGVKESESESGGVRTMARQACSDAMGMDTYMHMGGGGAAATAVGRGGVAVTQAVPLPEQVAVWRSDSACPCPLQRRFPTGPTWASPGSLLGWTFTPENLRNLILYIPVFLSASLLTWPLGNFYYWDRQN